MRRDRREGNSDSEERSGQSCKERNECEYQDVFGSVALLFPIVRQSRERRTYLRESLFEFACDEVDQERQLDVDDVLLPGSEALRVKDGETNPFAIYFLLQIMSLEPQCLVRWLRQILLHALFSRLLVIVVRDIANSL